MKDEWDFDDLDSSEEKPKKFKQPKVVESRVPKA